MAVIPDPGIVADETLLARYLAGEPEAGDRLLDRHQAPVRQFVRWYAGTDAAATDDLTQDVFVQVLRSAGRFRGGSTFRTWLFSVARHVCLHHRRRRRIRGVEVPLEHEGDAADLPALAPDTLDALVSRDLAATVRAHAAALPPHLGAVLALREWEGMAYEEIAAALEIPVGTVRSRLYHARARLLAGLAPLLGEPR